MAVIRLTKEFTFEAAHALEGYDGACRELHGHSYRLYVTVKGRPSECEEDPKQGMVVDFGVLKRIVNEQIVARLDHALVLRRTERTAPLVEALGEPFFQYRALRLAAHVREPAFRLRRAHRAASARRGNAPCPAALRDGDLYAEWYAEDNPDVR